MAITTSETPRDYGVVAFDGDRVTGIDEKPEGPVETNRINAGVYGFSPGIFDAIRSTHANGELALTETLDELAGENGGVNGIMYTGRWLDVSNLWDLLTVNAGMIDTEAVTHADRSDDASVHIADDVVLADSVRVGPTVTIGGNTAVGRNVTIEANAVVENSIIFPDAVIGAGAVVRDAVVASNAQIGPNVTIEGTPSTMVVGDTVHHGIELGGVVGDNTTIGPGATLTTGAVVGDDVDTDAGVTIDSRVAAGETVRRG
jgi:glucose-1-phosphate thymidylyltransferase